VEKFYFIAGMSKLIVGTAAHPASHDRKGFPDATLSFPSVEPTCEPGEGKGCGGTPRGIAGNVTRTKYKRIGVYRGRG